MIKNLCLFILLLSGFTAFAWNPPSLSYPLNGEETNTGLSLNWNAVASSEAYEIQLDTSSAFDSPLLITKIKTYINTSSSNSDTRFDTINLLFGTTYHYRVRAYITGDTSEWTTNYFNTREQIILASPSPGAETYAGLELDWNSHTGVYYYDYELDTSSNFNSSEYRSGTNTYINSSSINSDTEVYIENLLYGKTYYWRVRARNANDTSEWSVIANFTTKDIVNLTSPENESEQYTGVTLDWYAYENADFNEYQLDTTPLFNSPHMMTGENVYNNSSSYNNDTESYLTNLFFGTTYYWRVRARNTVDTTEWSLVYTFTTKDMIGLADPPDGSDQFSSVTIDWYAHKGVDLYEYQIDTSADFNSPLLDQGQNVYINSSSSNNDTEAYITGLLFGTTYSWRVRAINAVDTSSWSVVYSFTSRDIISISSPANQSDQYTGLTIDWYAFAGVSNYEYQLDTSLSFSSPAFITGETTYINSSSYNNDTEAYISDLYFGKTYYWRVRARTADDTTGWSNIYSFYTRDNVSLLDPTNGSTQYTGVNLDWYAHAGVDFYEYQLDTSQNFSSPVLISGQETYINSSSYNNDTEEYITDLYFGKTYHWKVRAINAVDTSQWSSIYSFTTYDIVNLSSPADEALDQNVSGVTLDWFAHAGVDYYDLEIDSSNMYNTNALQSTTNSYINSNSYNNDTEHNTGALVANTIYFWRVRARNAVDTSLWAERWFSTGSEPLVLPESPTLISPANASIDVNLSGQLVWSEVTDAVGYEYQITSLAGFYQADTITTDTFVNSFSNLDYNTTYYWRARTIGTNNYSDWSEIFSFTSYSNNLNTPNLVAPINHSTENTVSNLTFTWNSVLNADNYIFEIATDNGFTSIIEDSTLSDTSLILNNLAYNTQYFWRVKATSTGFTESNWSNIFDFYTEQDQLEQAILFSPENDSTGTPNDILLNWYPVMNAEQYTISYSTDPAFSISVQNTTSADTSVLISGLEYATQYYWKVKATAVGFMDGEWSAVWNFTSDSLQAPGLISPANGAINANSDTTVLQWEHMPYVTFYEYMYATNDTFYNANNDFIGESHAEITELSNATLYYWKVRAFDGTNYSQWSDIWTFTTDSVSAPILAAPLNDSTMCPLSMNLVWYSHPEAIYYEYRYDTIAGFTTAEQGNIADTSIQTIVLDYQKTYYWQVSLYNGSSYSQWSETWHFTTDSIPVPILATPANDSVNLPLIADLHWYPCEYVQGYEIEIDTTDTFTDSYTSFANDTVYTSFQLQPLTRYYWRIRCKSGGQSSLWSEIWAFETMDTLLSGKQFEVQEMKVYPNPNEGVFFIPKEWTTVKIINSYGQSVAWKHNGNLVEIESRSKGIYYIILNNKKEYVSKKIIVY